MRAFAASLLLLTTLAGLAPAPAAADAVCPPSNAHVWFLGVAYDSAERDDFKRDVLHFEAFLETLRDTYCIPASQAKILAMDGTFTIGSTTYSGYTAATEANVKSTLSSFGTAASAHTDSIFFYFHSSHGLAYAWPLSPCGVNRPLGSFAALGSGGGQDGSFYDCELGTALNSNFDSDVRMFVSVDCSFCGGFSDSTTAVSGTVDDSPGASGILGPTRIVVTGCAITTECFGGSDGSVLYHHMRLILGAPMSSCDRWTAPGFPTVQGFNVPAPIGSTNTQCGASEWFFASVANAYLSVDTIGIQQQFRIKFGPATLAGDLRIK